MVWCLLGPLFPGPPAGPSPFGPDEVVLILHADDLGMCHSMNAAGVEALRAGAVSSASVMVSTPWFPEMAEIARSHPEWDLGIHLTFTSEWEGYRWRPLTGRSPESGLLDPSGYYWKTLADVRDHASKSEMEDEMRAQIERALRAGLRPTHLDSHMGTVFSKPAFIESYVRLAAEYKIPCMLPKATPDLLERLKVRQSDHYTEEQLPWLHPPFAVVDRLHMDGVRGRTVEERRKGYHDLLRGLKPGVNVIIVHLAARGDEIEAILPRYAPEWCADLDIFIDPGTLQLIRDLNIRLIGWKDLSPLLGHYLGSSPGGCR